MLPRLGEFYSSATEYVGESAGDILRFEPVRTALLPGIRLPARSWRIVYRTTGALGQPVLSSGLVLVPRTPFAGPRPLLGYAVGTQGLGTMCAASLHLGAGIEYEAPFLAAALRRGWAIALTDYPGNGVGPAHPYLVGRALGPAVLDCMRAARALAPAELPREGPAALYGYSEGGTAAGWAAELQPAYAPDLPLVGAAVGGACADLEACYRHLEGGRFAWLQAWAAHGLDVAYPELDLDRYLTPRGRRFRATHSQAHVVSAILRGLPRKFAVDAIVTSNPLTEPDWLARIRENRLGTGRPSAPILLTHARFDQCVAYRQAPRLRDDWRAAGADVRFVGFPGLEHLTGGVAHASVGLPWLARRLAGAARAAERAAA